MLDPRRINRYVYPIITLGMKFMKIFFNLMFLFLLGMTPSLSAEKPLKITCSTFPLYQIVRNLTEGVKETQVSLLLPSSMGCPHDYVLTLSDLQKIHSADLLILNGAGMEAFLSPLLKTLPGTLKCLDSSKAGFSLIPVEKGHECKEEHCTHGHGEEFSFNPHFTPSPGVCASIALYLGERLAEADEKNRQPYLSNSRNYAEKLNLLMRQMKEKTARFKHSRIAVQHGSFDYLARDLNLKIISTLDAQDLKSLPASEMIALTLGLKNADLLITEPQMESNIAETLSKEARIPLVTLDPGLTGPENAPLDYFENLMTQNILTLEKYLSDTPK